MSLTQESQFQLKRLQQRFGTFQVRSFQISRLKELLSLHKPLNLSSRQIIQQKAPEVSGQVKSTKTGEKIMNTTTISSIEELVTFGLSIFAQVFSLFKHPTTPAPVSTAPEIISTLNATPGVTDAHTTVITNAVNAAAVAASK